MSASEEPQSEVVVKVVRGLDDVEPAAWDACATPDPATRNPFVSHTFLKCLEDAKTVTRRSGWMPHHLLLEDDAGALAACMPCYLKAHSQGEYIFDYGWADAFERAGGSYYPKLQCAVPFTPVPGPRLLVRPSIDAAHNARLLAAAAVELAKQNALSSLHFTFLTKPEWEDLGDLGFLQRTDKQFHWHNEGYDTFDAFLGALASRKRKAIRKERASALDAGLTVSWLRGRDITEAHWDAFFDFYQDTGARKWGRPYLNRRFFSLLGERMGEDCLLIMVAQGSRYIAGALNIIGGDCLYGRYWGALEHHPCLHFEVCYYQAVDFAIAEKLARVEAGAQGEHKLARGYVPVPTYSAHWIADRNFRAAVADYLEREREHMDYERDALATFTPFKKAD
ncbi:MAG: GNAT family N-acetyltransferase [Pseudomonadota bacterium]